MKLTLSHKHSRRVVTPIASVLTPGTDRGGKVPSVPVPRAGLIHPSITVQAALPFTSCNVDSERQGLRIAHLQTVLASSLDRSSVRAPRSAVVAMQCDQEHGCFTLAAPPSGLRKSSQRPLVGF